MTSDLLIPARQDTMSVLISSYDIAAVGYDLNRQVILLKMDGSIVSSVLPFERLMELLQPHGLYNQGAADSIFMTFAYEMTTSSQFDKKSHIIINANAIKEVQSVLFNGASCFDLASLNSERHGFVVCNRREELIAIWQDLQDPAASIVKPSPQTGKTAISKPSFLPAW